MTFAERLRALRTEKGLSEAALASASGVSFGAVHDYGLGRRMPSLPVAVKLARAMGVDCTAFADCVDVSGEPEAEPEKPARKKKGK
jgi:transcriptional regulator with XRE-family HTH domain